MKVLYLHGYEAKTNEDRIKYLIELGCEVYAPNIDYNKRPDIINELLKKDFDFIVGFSLGAYIGYFLSVRLEKPSILFNPPLHMELRDVGLSIRTPGYHRVTDAEDYEKWKMINIVLGGKDEIVKNAKVLEYFNSGWSTKPNANIVHYDNMGHIVTQEEFVDVVTETVKDYIEEEKENKSYRVVKNGYDIEVFIPKTTNYTGVEIVREDNDEYHEEIGVWVEDGAITDYDGTTEMIPELVEVLSELGFDTNYVIG
jgi:hypothetical protein